METTPKNIYKSMTDTELRNTINELETRDPDSNLLFALYDLMDKRIARRTRAALKEHAAGNAARLASRLTGK